MREPILDAVVDRLREATFSRVVEGEEPHATARRIFGALARSVGDSRAAAPATLSACDHLQAALENAGRGPRPVSSLAEAFARLVPQLRWQRRAGSRALGPAFADNHANTNIIGPEGIERRRDVSIGASLLAPRVRYPDHGHPPAELYVVMSEGEWYREDIGWQRPGIGGVVYNPPTALHAMRSGAEPLLAVWCLWARQ